MTDHGELAEKLGETRQTVYPRHNRLPIVTRYTYGEREYVPFTELFFPLSRRTESVIARSEFL